MGVTSCANVAMRIALCKLVNFNERNNFSELLFKPYLYNPPLGITPAVSLLPMVEPQRMKIPFQWLISVYLNPVC